jgi:hypothetical protein
VCFPSHAAATPRPIPHADTCGGIRVMTGASEWLLIYMILVMLGGMFATQRL